MLTVLIKFKSNGRQQVFQADSVEFHPTEGFTISFNKERETTSYAVTVDGEPYADAYVMNESGKTVACYVL